MPGLPDVVAEACGAEAGYMPRTMTAAASTVANSLRKYEDFIESLVCLDHTKDVVEALGSLS